MAKLQPRATATVTIGFTRMGMGLAELEVSQVEALSAPIVSEDRHDLLNRRPSSKDTIVSAVLAESSCAVGPGALAMTDFLIYGATGFTGRLIAEYAAERGLNPILAGRHAAGVRSLAERLGLRHRTFELGSRKALVDGLTGIAAVLHAAGPFSATSAPMVEACLAAGVHYCDITGEIDVFENLAARDAQAKAAGVMLMPGVGFDVVPSDCLAAHVAAKLPCATWLRRFGSPSVDTPGRAVARRRQWSRPIAQGVRVRRNGRVVLATGTPGSVADFGVGPRPTVGVSWGDVSTAWHSTGIPNIEVYFEADHNMRRAAAVPGFVKRALGTGVAKRFLKAQIDRRLPSGPTAEQRAQGRAVVVAEAWNAAGKSVVSRLVAPEPYALTALTAVEIANRAARGEVVACFQTPSMVFGADFISSFEGVERSDL